MKGTSGSVQSLENWKKEKKRKQNELSLVRYFKTLNFHDLINEAHINLENLRLHSSSSNVALESNCLIREISRRIEVNIEKDLDI